MGVEFKTNVNFKTIAKQIQEAQKKKLEIGMADAAAEIVKRTQSGRGSNEQGFADNDYSAAYEKKKKAAGRNTSVVDLTFTGKMLQAIQTKVRKLKDGLLEGKIYFLASQVNKARGNNARRRFMELSPKQVKALTEKMRRK